MPSTAWAKADRKAIETAGMTFRTLDDADVRGKRVLLRVDLNVPMENGKVADATRIERILPSIRELAGKGAKVILLAHFGRPKGKPDHENSLEPVADWLQANYGPTKFALDCIGERAKTAVDALKDGELLLLENTRFHAGEEKNDPAFVAELAKLGDIYVNDAFSAAHRAHASTEGLAHKLPAYAGRTMQAELDALTQGLEAPARPLVAIVGGAKVSTKLELLSNLVKKVDVLVIGGAMANTFLLAEGTPIGKSLAEPDLMDTARRIYDTKPRAEIPPVHDVVVAPKLARDVPVQTVPVSTVPADQMILDFGPETVREVIRRIDQAATLVWNGPLGAFETPPFDTATVAIARHVAARTKAGKLVSVAGGGDTVAALNAAGVAGDFSYVSTAGGAFLEWLEGKALPGVEALRVR
jgi:phosphoglycerate kinase